MQLKKQALYLQATTSGSLFNLYLSTLPSIFLSVVTLIEGWLYLIDVSSLPGLLVRSSRPSDVLWSCQIDKVQFADLADLVAIEGTLVHVHGHGEDGVGSGRKIVLELHSTLSKYLDFF